MVTSSPTSAETSIWNSSRGAAWSVIGFLLERRGAGRGRRMSPYPTRRWTARQPLDPRLPGTILLGHEPRPEPGPAADDLGLRAGAMDVRPFGRGGAAVRRKIRLGLDRRLPQRRDHHGGRLRALP